VPYYVYIIQCDGNSFYTGYTKNLNSRMRLHLNGKGARYTRMHRPRKLVYTEEFGSIAEAMKREKQIKRLNHRQKLGLANSRTRPKQHRRKAKFQE
jgi:putative endonuclease